MVDEKNPKGFVIDGEVLEVPTLDSLDMDEAQILFDLSGVVIEDFIPAHPDSSDEEKLAVTTLQNMRLRTPAFGRAFAHVAYRRAHPEADFDAIQELVGKANAAQVTIAMILGGDDDEDPLEISQKLPEPRSSTNGTSEPSSSGSPSRSDSAEQDATQLLTGTGASATSSPEWPVPRSAS